jgi:hypothetical protein
VSTPTPRPTTQALDMLAQAKLAATPESELKYPEFKMLCSLLVVLKESWLIKTF